MTTSMKTNTNSTQINKFFNLEPSLISLGIDVCKLSLFGEIRLTDKQSVSLSINNFQKHEAPLLVPAAINPAHPEGAPSNSRTSNPPLGNISLEARHYFAPEENRLNRGFASFRTSNSGNIGFGLGFKSHHAGISFTPRIAISYNIFNKQVKPACGYSFEFNL